MLKGLGDMGKIMKLQRELKNVQKKLKSKITKGENSDGSVAASVDGEYRLIELKLDQGLLDSADKKKLEKAIISAVNDAVEKSKEYAAGEMSKLTGGLNIPGLDNMLE